MIRSFLLTACLSALPALAFEGVIDMKMSGSTGSKDQKQQINGTGTLTIKGLNSRFETVMSLPGMTAPTKMAVIHKASEPNVTYMVYEATKTYHRMDTKNDEAGDRESASRYTVKRLGKDTIAGRTTEHVLITREGGEDTEVWVDRNLVSVGDLEKAFSSGNRPGAWWSALKKEGVAGVPLKVVSKSKDGSDRGGMEATRVQAKSVSSSEFEVPAGYTEAKAGSGGAFTPQQREEMMKKAMERMSPEQRQRVEEMMKQHGGSGQ
jgi:hypothetical protein